MLWSRLLLLLLFAMVTYVCEVCRWPCLSRAGLGAHMRTHRNESVPAASTRIVAGPIKPPYDDYGRALWYFRHNETCESCSLGGELIPCSYCSLTWHRTCAGLASVPAGYFLCPSCVVAESEGQDMGTTVQPSRMVQLYGQRKRRRR